jgi:hypothetical protein
MLTEAGFLDAYRPPVGLVGEEDADLLEGLPDHADEMREGFGHGEPEARRRGVDVELRTPCGRVVGIVVRLDLAAGKDVIAGGELAFAVTLDQEQFGAAGGTIAEQHERGRGDGNDRWFDAHRASVTRSCGAVTLRRLS